MQIDVSGNRGKIEKSEKITKKEDNEMKKAEIRLGVRNLSLERPMTY